MASGRKTHLNEDQKKRIIRRVMEEGVSFTNVAKSFNVSPETVGGIVRKHKKEQEKNNEMLDAINTANING